MYIVFFSVLLIGIAVLSIVILTKHLKAKRKILNVKKTVANNNLGEISGLKKIVASNRDDLMSLYKLAKLQIQSGEAADGVRNTKNLLERDLVAAGIPQIKVVLLMADGLMILGKEKESFKNLMVAKGLDKTNAEVNLKIAKYYYEFDKDYRNSFAYANRALKIDPSYKEAYLYTGMSAYELASYTNAIENLMKVFEYDKSNYSAAIILAKTFSTLNKIPEAESVFKVASGNAVKDEEKFEANYEWGLFKKSSGDNQKILKHFNDAFVFAKTPELQKNILQEMLKIYETEKAISKVIWCLEKLIYLIPDDSGLSEKLGIYKELYENNSLQQYAYYPPADFEKLCVKLTKNISNCSEVIRTEVAQDGSIDVMGLKPGKKKNTLYQFRFVRGDYDVGEMIVRDLYMKAKTNKAHKSVFVTNSNFSETAKEFAANRVLDLVNKELLLSHLKRV